MKRDVAGEQEERGQDLLIRVKLDADLEPTGQVTATITEPVNPEDPETAVQADFWRDTARKIYKVRNGLPMVNTIPQGAICWVTRYSGKWCVLIPECD